MEIINDNFALVYSKLLNTLINNPEYNVSPRGEKVYELKDISFEIKNPLECLYSNNRRSSQFKYIAAELLWYFNGDNNIDFIKKYAKFWERISDENKNVNSAYGNLILTKKNQYNLSQLEWVLESLLDKDTRQAVMHFNTPDHQYKGNKDFVCTIYANFLIRENKLHMTVHMRSNDVILGLPTDIAFFTVLQQQILFLLKDKYPELELGTYKHIVNSLHLYERNLELVKEMLQFKFNTLSMPILNESLIDKNGKCSNEFKYVYDKINSGNNIFNLSDNNILSWIIDNIQK